MGRLAALGLSFPGRVVSGTESEDSPLLLAGDTGQALLFRLCRGCGDLGDVIRELRFV